MNMHFYCFLNVLYLRFTGNIIRADVALSPAGKSRGFGTVLFSSVEEANIAMSKFNNYEWNGRKIEVREDRAVSGSLAGGSNFGNNGGNTHSNVHNFGGQSHGHASNYNNHGHNHSNGFQFGGSLTNGYMMSQHQGQGAGYGARTS